MSLIYSQRAVNAKAEALGQLLDGGWLVLYGGPQPRSPEIATDQAELIRVRFARPAFGPAEEGTVIAHEMTSNAATHEGIAVWCRAYQANGKTAVWDGTVGLTEATVTLRSLAISKGAVLVLRSLTLTERTR